MIEEAPTNQGLYFLHYIFISNSNNFLINLLLPSGYPLHMPTIFFIFATPFCDSHLQLPFVTHVHDPHLRLTVSQLPRHATPPVMDGLCQHPSVISLVFQP